MDNLTYNSDSLTPSHSEQADGVDRRGILQFGGRAALAGVAAGLIRPPAAGATSSPEARAVIDRGAPSIDSRQGGSGDGLFAHIENVANANRAVFGRTVGVGIAIVASVANEHSSASASKGTTVGSGPGVEGQSALGVGGKFAGKAAQLELVPSTAVVPPATGAAGQLFVDRANRLWFCQGGSAWKQLA